jgi:NADH dehydrogenase
MPEGGNRPILVTGANGHIGRRLLVRMAEQQTAARAVVRSQRAAATLEALPEAQRPELQIVDYADPEQLSSALEGCRAAVHLVGVIKESRDAPFEAAHERPCEALAKAADAAGVEHIVALSIVGADGNSSNACLASRGRSEAILLEGRVPATIVRVPMVLGPGDYATAALRGQASSRLAVLVGGGATLQQPIDAEDVVAAILAALARPELASTVLELGGPECLSHRELVMRAAALHDSRPSVVPIPVALVRTFAALAARLLPSPPITPAMLGVLQHDDRVDTADACKQLGIELTPLDATLRAYVGPEPKA